MWSVRLIIGVLAVTICVGTSLSTGAGRAAALPPATKEIIAAAEEVVPPLVKRLGLGGTFIKTIESLFESQATKLTPVKESVELNKFKTEWTSFQPRKPPSEEVAPVRGKLPSAYKQAGQMLCGTALDLLSNPNQARWEYLIKQVNNQIAAQNPLGKNLVIYSELNDIYEKFRSGCYCAATAELAVFFAKQRYCEGEE
ncbi:hypothetical protein OG874_28490 [Nocardia sp. NBC_00565]|uniref:hypothetical protein n=1 Tax=Nocardia sp. NBC_00565 TaxID=2975993 RepID=UPI002E81531C|nr:hypothetical protein [Nocardia sp. NBC_00565]WUC00768.1 hypothetical protein OG874_28490 [Nocardia sp. NBC_00565]